MFEVISQRRKFISGKRPRFGSTYPPVNYGRKNFLNSVKARIRASVVNIFVKEGDTVAKDQAILELENEKAVASIPSTGAGVVARVHVKAGDRVGVGARLITITESGQPVAAPVVTAAPKPAAKKVVAQAAPEPEETVEESAGVEEEVSDAAVAASPSIRKMARELGINLGKIRGSESGGRIVISDVRAYIQRLVKAAAKPAAVAASAAAPTKPAPVQIDFSQWGPVTKKSVTPLRKVIARRMSESCSHRRSCHAV